MIRFHFSFVLLKSWDSDESEKIELGNSQGLEMITALEKHYFEYFLTVLGNWFAHPRIHRGIQKRLKMIVWKWIEKNKPKLEGEDSEKCFNELWKSLYS